MSATSVTKAGPKERRFSDALRDLFVGVKVDGQSGYINLMRIKAAYFQKVVEPTLLEDVAKALKNFPEFREEMFDKLHAFFSRYFSRSGSICFAYTPQHMSVYEKVYTDEQDVVLFWKTHMLYYVKTDRIFRDLKVELDGRTFFFDCTNLEHKKSNEKRELVFSLDKVEKDGAIHLAVTYSERGRVTKTDDILKALKQADHSVKEAVLEKAMSTFARQSEVDYFINKDARAFLREQFDLWMYQYVFKDDTYWSEARIRQLQALKDIAFKLIDFISQFEDELVRIWNKPKFVRGTHYVVTMDRLAAKKDGLHVIADLLKHAGMKAQVAEWQELGIVEADFSPKGIIEGRGKEQKLDAAWKFLPIDTCHFKSLELRILSLFENLDEELDGRLIKSENYQALNTLKEKFKGRVKLFYIDPPYNTGQDEFIYEDAIQSASWLTMMKDRVLLARTLLSRSGSFAVNIDENEFSNCLRVLDETFPPKSRAAIASVKRGSVTGHKAINPGLVNVTEYVPIYAAERSAWLPNKLFRPRARNDRYSSFIKNRGEHYSKWQFCSLLDAFAEFRGIPKNMLKKELGFDLEDQLFKFICDNRDAVVQFARPDSDKVSQQVREAIQRSKKEPSRVLHVPRVGESDFYLIRGERILFYADRLQEVDGELVTVEPLSDIWDDVVPNDLHNEGGVELKKGKKPERLLQRLVELCTVPTDIVADSYVGSGTSICVAHKAGRKWLGVEFGEHFKTKALVRIKKVLAGDQSGVSVSLRWKGGGFFKYFRLEQYEEAVASSTYAEDNDLFRNTKTDAYSQYVFFRDLKMAQALELDYKKDEVNVHLDRLYPDIDLAETLSCVTGKWIKRITEDEVEFADGTKQSLKKPDWRLLKPLIFWGPVV
jgi:adenine-specific DNA-methyltransferase